MEDKKYTRNERTKLNRELKPQGKRCCPNCEEVKPLEEFTTGGKLKSGEVIYRLCYPCNRIKTKKSYNPEKKAKYYEENKERIQEYREQNKEKSATDSNKWREENKEYLKEYRKKRWIENKEELSKRNKQYREKNKERLLEKQRKYREENREIITERQRIYREENKERLLERQRKYREENKDRIKKIKREWYNKKLKTDKLFDLKESIRKCIYGKIKTHKKFSTCDILGCDYETLKVHIENQFQEGMTWDNHGQFGWHYDHIIPVSSAKTEEELYQLNHYTNFQPLWWDDNLSKSDKLNWEQVED